MAAAESASDATRSPFQHHQRRRWATRGGEHAEEAEDCSICLEPIASDARQTLRCSHSFCAPCIKAVARKAAAEDAAQANRLGVVIPCPLCRSRERVRI